MKKTVLLSLSAIFVLSLLSCRKNRTCECTTTDKTTGAIEENYSYTIRTTKREMNTVCNSYAFEDAYEKMECKIK